MNYILKYLKNPYLNAMARDRRQFRDWKRRDKTGRPALRSKVLNDRLGLLKSTWHKIGEAFPAKEYRLHYDLLKMNLKSTVINWNKVQPSIRYVSRYLSRLDKLIPQLSKIENSIKRAWEFTSPEEKIASRKTKLEMEAWIQMIRDGSHEGHTTIEKLKLRKQQDAN